MAYSDTVGKLWLRSYYKHSFVMAWDLWITRNRHSPVLYQALLKDIILVKNVQSLISPIPNYFPFTGPYSYMQSSYRSHDHFSPEINPRG